jgi:predicted DsbA family dithiol-disulfide isomerase
MHIEIWSDLMCPFCYIGKRNFEAALGQFEHRDEVNVTWRSFQLAPDLPHRVEGDVHDYLAAKYGGGRENAKAMNARVTETAAAAGLEYRLDSAVMGNTFDAHRLIHAAARHGLQDEAEERLFRAYFSEGRHLADHETLVELATDIGLDAAEVRAMLASDDHADAVRAEIAEAHALGINGVPAFVVDRRYAITGAQPPESILSALEQIRADGQSRDAA